MGASAAVLAIAACGDDPAGNAATMTDAAATTSASESGDDPSAGSSDAAEDGSSGDACDPTWATIPDQTWVVGEPVELDLAPYLEGADATALAVMLEGTLPEGITLDGTVLRGTPTTPTETELSAAVDVEGC